MTHFFWRKNIRVEFIHFCVQFKWTLFLTSLWLWRNNCFLPLKNEVGDYYDSSNHLTTILVCTVENKIRKITFVGNIQVIQMSRCDLFEWKKSLPEGFRRAERGTKRRKFLTDWLNPFLIFFTKCLSFLSYRLFLFNYSSIFLR